MTTIRNTNDKFGSPVEFCGETLDEAVANMQVTLWACGPEFELAP